MSFKRISLLRSLTSFGNKFQTDGATTEKNMAHEFTLVLASESQHEGTVTLL